MDTVFQNQILELEIPLPCPFAWHQPTGKLELAAGQIHIWKADLDSEDDFADQGLILSTNERQRADRFISSLKRSRFRAAHCALRKILSVYINQTPEDIEFRYGHTGKPYLVQAEGSGQIEFNLAHADHLMLLAITLDIPVGIDLEKYQAVSAKEWILRQYFSQKDLAALRNLPATDQNGAFIHAWTVREACGKSSGDGLACPTQTDYFIPGQEKALPVGHYEVFPAGSLCCLRLNPAAGFSACAAVQSAQELQPYFWNFGEKSKVDTF
jgi:4'-phosphopantetheinyl transferase